jgi:hypothetical protein
MSRVRHVHHCGAGAADPSPSIHTRVTRRAVVGPPGGVDPRRGAAASREEEVHERGTLRAVVGGRGRGAGEGTDAGAAHRTEARAVLPRWTRGPSSGLGAGQARVAGRRTRRAQRAGRGAAAVSTSRTHVREADACWARVAADADTTLRGAHFPQAAPHKDDSKATSKASMNETHTLTTPMKDTTNLKARTHTHMQARIRTSNTYSYVLA